MYLLITIRKFVTDVHCSYILKNVKKFRNIHANVKLQK